MKPVVFDLPRGLTPNRAWSCFARDEAIAFLDSHPGYGSLSRYSIIGLDPWLTFRAWPGHCQVNGIAVADDAWAVLERLLADNRNEPLDGLPITGGAIGSIAYDAGFSLNRLETPDRALNLAGPDCPWISFDFYDTYLVFDSVTGQNRLLLTGRLNRPDVRRDQILSRLEQVPDNQTGQALRSAPKAGLQIPAAADYMARVETIREHIRQGDVYIANLTHVFESSSEQPAHSLYDRLRRINPAPFAAFVRQGDLEILSSSPERLLSIDRDGHLVTRPIKGTRARSRDMVQDEAFMRELIASDKDRAELLMITDLERNDLSRVCRPESVRVSAHFTLETYPQVYHLSSTVEGDLETGISPVSALLACFPGGSISGAPKASAMQILDRLETSARSLYTGCLGYFSFDGQTDFSILIRTAFKTGSRLFYGAGGGITWESDPRAEYEEMLLKAEAFRQLIEEG